MSLLLATAAAALIALFWLLVALLPLRRFPRDHFVRPAGPPSSTPRVAVLVPARDEAAVLPETLPSLLAQDYPDFEVVLIDDASSDGTARIAEELASARPAARFRRVAAGEKPAGWAGKMHALACGVEAVLDGAAPAEGGGSTGAASTGGGSVAAPTWLLLTDADIRHPRDSITALMAKAQRGGYDLVSVMARLSTSGAWERLLIPPFVYFFHLLYPFRAVSHRSSTVAAAAGGCVLVRASALQEAGGFAAIRDALIDDVALARLLKSRRRRLWLGLDPAIESVRRYSFADLWRMVARSAFVQLGYRYWLVPVVAVALAFFFAGPSAIAVLSLYAIAAGAAIGPPLVAFALAGVARLLQTAVLLPWVRHHRIRHVVAWSLTFPLAALLYGAMTAGSAWDHLRGRGSAWKGRGYERAPGPSSAPEAQAASGRPPDTLPNR